MAVAIIKSPLQLKHEIEKTKRELNALLTNWKKKKNTSQAKLLAFRADMKEMDALLAETEKGYSAYCALLGPLSRLMQADPERLNTFITDLEQLQPALASCLIPILQQAHALTNDAAGTETSRVLQAREAHKNASRHILQKTREIYAAMKEEKGKVEAYSARLTTLIAEKTQQLQHQNNPHQMKIYGMGL